MSTTGPVTASVPTPGSDHTKSVAMPSAATLNAVAASTTSSVSHPTSTPTTKPFPPPKSDKPRPHVCQECMRSFARLEHLKRHERSHTKEKPFACPVCNRCFARRDLLLRHQQKLHATGPPSATRPRNGRRDSSGVMPSPGAARGRRPSMATDVSASSAPMMRPRANTISHIDLGAHGILAQASANRNPNGVANVYGHHTSASIGANHAYSSLGMPSYASSYGSSMPSSATLPASAHHTPTQAGFPNSLRIDTSGLGMDIGGGMRTAPVFTNPAYESFFGPSSSTINPAHLHFGVGDAAPPQSPFATSFGPYSAGLEGDAHFDWTTMEDNFLSNHESAIDQSSPSAISQNSAFSEVMIDGSNNPATITASGAMWTDTNGNLVVPANFMNDPVSEAMFPELMTHMGLSSGGIGTDMAAQAELDSFMTMSGHMSMSPVPGTSPDFLQSSLTFGSDTPKPANSSAHGHHQHSPVVHVTSTITDTIRQALLFTLTQESSSYGHTARRYSHSAMDSPELSADGRPQISLPTSADLRRYIQAYILYFHPHMPFLHIATLNFSSLVFSDARNQNPSTVDGGGCLLLAMASIGAYYEYEHSDAKQLFDQSKMMIKLYLDRLQRRSSSMVTGGSLAEIGRRQTPLWLVQAMLLNIILGHQSGDRVSAEIATTHCASLVSLAKDAQLDKASPTVVEEETVAWSLRKKETSGSRLEFAAWFKWKSIEERKRTLFSVFVTSNMLVLAYNQAPRIFSSELRLDLPCEENLWMAEDAASWRKIGGERATNLGLQDALTYLLNAHRRGSSGRRTSGQTALKTEIRPSSMGCYILIHALHQAIWDAQSQFSGTDRTQAAQRLRNQLEPALREWQTAWRLNPLHKLERPNPFGPISADCVPLLDLAYIRLYVNLTRSKEALWTWDFDAMAQALADESSIDSSTAHIYNPSLKNWSFDDDDDLTLLSGSHARPAEPTAAEKKEVERMLRKAAFYAADSLVMSSHLSTSLSEYTSRELPVGAAMCTFDCAQIVAEWIATVQDRLGCRIRAIIGRDPIEPSSNPAFLELEEDDLMLLSKVREILTLAGSKIAADLHAKGHSPEQILAPMEQGGCGYSLLMVTAHMLGRAPIWGIQSIMTGALRQHADKLRERAEASIVGAPADHGTLNDFVMSNF